MSGDPKSLISAALDDLETRIKSARVVDVVYHPSPADLAIRQMIEKAKPMKTLDEVTSRELDIPPEPKETFTEEPTSEEFKTSFREVLRLAKAGQQSWWTDKLKNSTDSHIECMDEYYRQNYSDETTD